MRTLICAENNRKGYVAVIAAIIISAVILVIVSVISTGSFLARLNISNSSFKERSLSLARACVQKALFKLAENGSYAGNEAISVASDTCQIVSVVASGTTQKVVSTQAQFRSSFTNLKVTVDSPALSVAGWEELPHF